ncbi:glutathione S-transferase N-terminal domain-containing protein [Azospirillum sp. TSO35-2]|uniref:glutathione S-transferase N-terminal domain-containing protein n=1 Tax=Azospirillum sp. TSO35-2 TaxID=716796 RepID=UPI000D615EFC|nr:glutathione S-transferase N-terminal domain-containing protein [Azospirillum sp. TSO35-2]PWC34315.1 glutathione S-transferase [Azospirillum sp. TSO35-2]
MILYHHAGACSLADHIALIEAELPYRLVSVDRDKRTDDGRDFLAINPRGYVPALELDDGTVLTENLAILAYIAHRSGRLLPPDGITRWRALEATSFMTTELHGNFKPFFYPDATQAEKDKAAGMLARHFASIAGQLGDGAFLLGDRMTIADAYLFVMLMWAPKSGIELPERLRSYFARMKEVPSVARALAEEGLA